MSQAREKVESKGSRTTDMNERPMARNTLLLASSGCNMTCGGGKSGIDRGGVEPVIAFALGLVVGEGLMRRKAVGESAGDWRRAEGLIEELERIRVPY